ADPGAPIALKPSDEYRRELGYADDRPKSRAQEREDRNLAALAEFLQESSREERWGHALDSMSDADLAELVARARPDDAVHYAVRCARSIDRRSPSVRSQLLRLIGSQRTIETVGRALGLDQGAAQ